MHPKTIPFDGNRRTSIQGDQANDEELLMRKHQEMTELMSAQWQVEQTNSDLELTLVLLEYVQWVL